MTTIDELPPDQLAVLQLVLQRGRSYEEIAGLLSIDPTAVRERALAATSALGGSRRPEGYAELTDYLLNQGSERDQDAGRGRMLSSDLDREWARSVRTQLEQLAPGSMPDISVGALAGADVTQPAPTRSSPDPAPVGEPKPAAAGEPAIPPPPNTRAPRAATPSQSSRRGGAVLLGVLVVIVIAVVLVLLLNGGGSSTKHPLADGSTLTQQAGTSTDGSAPKLLAALNLTSPTGSSKTLGVAQVIREKGVTGVVINAQGMPPNTAHDAYGVWLYKSATDSTFVGFVPKLVGQNGKLQTEGRLPADATDYSRLLVTLETKSKPTTPGEIVLSGPFNEGS